MYATDRGLLRECQTRCFAVWTTLSSSQLPKSLAWPLASTRYITIKLSCYAYYTVKATKLNRFSHFVNAEAIRLSVGRVQLHHNQVPPQRT